MVMKTTAYTEKFGKSCHKSLIQHSQMAATTSVSLKGIFMMLGCSQPSLRIDAILYGLQQERFAHGERNTCNGSNRLATERSERDKDPSEQQLELELATLEKAARGH